MEKRKLISPQMLGYEFRNVIGDPYVHIFGVCMQVMAAVPGSMLFLAIKRRARIRHNVRR